MKRIFLIFVYFLSEFKSAFTHFMRQDLVVFSTDRRSLHLNDTIYTDLSISPFIVLCSVLPQVYAFGFEPRHYFECDDNSQTTNNKRMRENAFVCVAECIAV